MRFLAFILLVSACNFVDEPHYEVDQRLEGFVNEFFIQAELRGIYCRPDNLIVQIKPLQNNYSGLTEHNHIKTVYIDQAHYDDHVRMALEVPERSQYFIRAIEMTVFHELGHAILGLGHSSGIMGGAGEIPVHNYCIDDLQRQKLIDDLFSK